MIQVLLKAELEAARLKNSVRMLFLLVLFSIGLLFSQSELHADASPILITIENHIFKPSEVHVPAHQRVVLLIKNLDASDEEFESAALQIEKVISAKSEARVFVRPSEHGRYSFAGEYNEKTARGVLVVD